DVRDVVLAHGEHGERLLAPLPHLGMPATARAADAGVVDLAVRGEDRVDQLVVGGVDARGVAVHQLLDLVLVGEVLERAGRDHWAEYPPSTGSTTPVTNDAASEHSQSTASATSGDLPIRPSGCMPWKASGGTSMLTAVRSISGVSTMPGEVAFTRMPTWA